MAKDKIEVSVELGPGEVLTKVTELLEQHRVMVVEDMQRIRGELLQGLADEIDRALDERLVPGEMATFEDPSGPELSAEEMALIVEGWKAYGVGTPHQFASDIDRTTNEAVLVTNGGAKVRYRAGQKVEALAQVRITGINPNPKRRQITGAKK